MQKVSFFLMTYKGLFVLEEFLKEFSSEVIDCVVSAEDKNVEKDYYFEIKELCFKYKINFFNKNEKYDITSHYSFAISWKWLLKDIDRLIIFHDGLLPKYRGFAPVVNALINGEKKVGVTALYAKEEYDKGDIIIQKEIQVIYPVKINAMIFLLAKNYASLAIDIAQRIFNGQEIKAVLQDESIASYSLWRDDDDYFINWNKDAEYVKRFIDSVGYPYKGAKSRIGTKGVRILDASVVDDVYIENRDHGKVIFLDNGFPIIVCGRGLIRISKMIDDVSGTDLLPLKNMRTRFS